MVVISLPHLIHGVIFVITLAQWCDFCHLHHGNTNVFFLEKCTSMYIEQNKKIFLQPFFMWLVFRNYKGSKQLGMDANLEDAPLSHMKVCIKFNTFTLVMVMCQILHSSVQLGATPKPKSHLWQRTTLSKNEIFITWRLWKNFPWFFCKLEDLLNPTNFFNFHVWFFKRMCPWGFFFMESFASIGNSFFFSLCHSFLTLNKI